MFEIGDNLSSKVNKIFNGYYTVIDITKTVYILRAMEKNGKPLFEEDKYGIYKTGKKWAEKHMVKLPPRPPEIQEDENDFIDLDGWNSSDWDWDY